MCALRWIHADIASDSVYVCLTEGDRSTAKDAKNHVTMKIDSRKKIAVENLGQPTKMIVEKLGRMCVNNCAEKFTSSLICLYHHTDTLQTRPVHNQWTIYFSCLWINEKRWTVYSKGFKPFQRLLERWGCKIYNCFFFRWDSYTNWMRHSTIKYQIDSYMYALWGINVFETDD